MSNEQRRVSIIEHITANPLPDAMPPQRTKPTTSSTSFSSRSQPFKPPGPPKKPPAQSRAATTSATKPKPQKIVLTDEEEDDDEFGTAIDIDIDDADADAGLDGLPTAFSSPSSPIETAASRTTASTSTAVANVGASDPKDASVPGIPHALLTRIMHTHFKDKTTNTGREANEMVRRYVDIFIREAVARAAESQREEKRRIENDSTKAKGKGVEDDDIWLETEDLERITPGMLMDF